MEVLLLAMLCPEGVKRIKAALDTNLLAVCIQLVEDINEPE